MIPVPGPSLIIGICLSGMLFFNSLTAPILKPAVVKHEQEHYSHYIVHKITVDKPITDKEIENIAIKNEYWGYHPIGYGGTFRRIDDRTFEYRHYDSCE